MGLFSKKKTFIESSSQLLLEETPNLIKDSIFTSVMNNTNIPEDLTANYLGSLYVKGRRMRKYAEDHYPYGLPDGTLNYPTASNRAVKAVLEAELGITVLVTSTVIDLASSLRNSTEFLVNTREWDESTNEVANPPSSIGVGRTVFLDDTEFISNTQTKITYVYYTDVGWPIPSEQPVYVDEVVTHDAVVQEHLYYYVTYYETIYNDVTEEYEITGDLLFWTYEAALGTYPSLDITTGTEQNSRYYPIVPIRRNKNDLTDPSLHGTELYKTSKRMLKMWNVDIDELAEGVNASPNINDVDHAYVITAIDIAADSQSVYSYLYEYFIYLSDRSDYFKGDFDTWLLEGLEENETPPVNTITVSDAGYRMDLSYNYITTEIKSGSIGDVGLYEREVIASNRASSDYFDYETSQFIIRKQLTTNFYQEVLVYGLYHINYVYPNATVDTSLQDAFNSEDEKNNFLIPLNVDVSDNVSRYYSNELVYYSLRIVFNSKITKKLKWYETGFFQVVIKIVAVVLTVYGLYQVGAALVAATAVGVIAVAQVIITAILVSIAVNYVLDFLVSVIGLEGVFVVILAAVAAAYGGYNPSIGSIGYYELPTAIDFMQVTNVALSEFQTVIQESVQDVMDEIENFANYAEDLIEDLDEEYGFENFDLYSLDVFQSSMTATETPEEFLTRTTYNDNVGVLALETPSTFVDRMLKFDIPSNDINLDI
jgi:hypothetical protein